ncbi:hypothetical protein [Yinghuangia sp. YIM S10712]
MFHPVGPAADAAGSCETGTAHLRVTNALCGHDIALLDDLT